MTVTPGVTNTGSRAAPGRGARPWRIGTRGSPLALIQARTFMTLLRDAFAALREPDALREQVITTTGDAVQDRRLADIGGKGLFAKEIHEALADGRIDFAVHSLKDLETQLPDGIVLACALTREDARDALILSERCGEALPSDPLGALPRGAVVGTSSVRRQAQLLHARPDLQVATLRGNVQTRLAKLRDGQCDATMLALAGLNRLGLSLPRSIVLDPDVMTPSACQGIVGITIRADDSDAQDLLAAIEDPSARIVATAERAMLDELDGSCRTPIGGYASQQADGRLLLTGTVARSDGSFLLTRSLDGAPADARLIGQALGKGLRRDAPADLFD